MVSNQEPVIVGRVQYTLKFLLYVGPVLQYIACTAELAYIPVRIIGNLEYLFGFSISYRHTLFSYRNILSGVSRKV